MSANWKLRTQWATAITYAAIATGVILSLAMGVEAARLQSYHAPSKRVSVVVAPGHQESPTPHLQDSDSAELKGSGPQPLWFVDRRLSDSPAWRRLGRPDAATEGLPPTLIAQHVRLQI